MVQELPHTKLLADVSLGTLKGIGNLGGENNNLDTAAGAADTFTGMLSNIIGILTIVGIIWFIITLLTGAISWLSSGGDKVKLEKAQKQISTGVIGLVIVLSAIFLADLAGTIFGIPNILSISDFILELRP